MKKKKWIMRIFPILLVTVLLLGILPTSAAQQEEAAPVSAIVSEVIGLRDECVKHFLCEDGSYIAATYASPVHYKENGVWKDVDDSLILNSRALSAAGKATYTPRAAALPISLPQDFTDGQQITVCNKGYTFGFGVSAEGETVSLRSAATLVDTEELPSALTSQREASPEKRGAQTKAEQVQEQNAEKMATDNLSSAVVYKRVFPNTDLEYVVTPGRLKENIVVAVPQAEYTYSFNVSMDGLAATSQEDGSILLVEAGNRNNVVFSIQAPFMYDANDEYSYNVKMVLENGVLTVTADSAWLNDAVRAFPVIIDPTINTNSQSVISDGYVTTLFPNSSGGTNSLRLYTGKVLIGGERNRAYVKFSLPNIPTGSVVTYAQFELMKSSSNNLVLEVRDLYPSSAGYLVPEGVSWNNQPVNAAANSATSFPLVDSRATDSGSTWYRFNITSAMQRWYAGSNRNNGLVITTPNENNAGQAGLCSTGATTSNRPVLWFQYSGVVNISYNGNGHTGGTVPTSHTATMPGTIILKQPGTMVKDGYTFGGWSYNGHTYVAGATLSWGYEAFENLTFTAVWVPPILGSVTINYSANGGTGTVPISQTVGTPGSVVLGSRGNLAKAGYTFGGWKRPDGVIQLAGSAMSWSSVTNGSLTLEAVWLDEVELLFNQVNANGVTGIRTSSAYYQRLGTFAMRLSYGAYNEKQAKYPQLWEEIYDPLPVPKPVPAGSPLQGMLGTYGFPDVLPYEKSSPTNSVGHTIAHRKIAGPNGPDSRSLVVVTIRGTDDFDDFLTDVSAYLAFDCSGLNAATQEVQTHLTSFLGSHSIENDRIVLITGHSLGGAIANLLAANLNAAPGWGQEKVYSYTFGTPYVRRGNTTAYSNIFNILNRNDNLTYFPWNPLSALLTWWGRNGKDILINMTYNWHGFPSAPFANHGMPVYYGWMKAQDQDLDYNGVMAISNQDKAMGVVPWLLRFKCPVGVAAYDSEDNLVAFESQLQSGGGYGPPQGGGGVTPPAPGSGLSSSDVFSWITEEGEKMFFIPYGCDVSYIHIVAYGDDHPMSFTAATLDDGIQPLEVKVFENVELFEGKEFFIDLDGVAVSDVQLLLMENGEIIGEVAEDGSETIY